MATGLRAVWDSEWENDSVDETECHKVDQTRPIFDLPMKDVLVQVKDLGIASPDLDKIPGFIQEMSLNQMIEFAKSVTFADLKKMFPAEMLDQLKVKLGNVNSDNVTDQIKNLMNQVH